AYLLEGVTVTTTRAPALRTELPQKVEVVTRTDLERTVAADVSDALKTTATVDGIQYPALLSDVAMRGLRPQSSGISPRTLILLDGRPAGATNLASFDLSAVERVEVLKGLASMLYGASAVGGVVNIVTRRWRGPLQGSADMAYGSFDTYRGDLTVGGALTEALDFDLGLSTTARGSGYRIGANRLLGGDSVTKVLAGGEVVRLPQLPGDTTLAFTEYAQRSANLRLGYSLSEAWRLEGQVGGFAADDV